MSTIVKITPNEKGNPPGKLADAELHFSGGELDGLKLIGFAVWERRGRIVRSAHPHLQSLLVQAAWRVWRASDPKTEPFRAWAQAIARRRGKKVGDPLAGDRNRSRRHDSTDAAVRGARSHPARRSG